MSQKSVIIITREFNPETNRVKRTLEKDGKVIISDNPVMDNLESKCPKLSNFTSWVDWFQEKHGDLESRRDDYNPSSGERFANANECDKLSGRDENGDMNSSRECKQDRSPISDMQHILHDVVNGLGKMGYDDRYSLLIAFRDMIDNTMRNELPDRIMRDMEKHFKDKMINSSGDE